ncbi:hypothetical protein C7974DRAFT_440680 [Boeremia exigua]|uniref:uncharacterized protein n=1 Tax=Boeremia exigua TaxID=749465 RepID=UPI001E8EA248|nr:uncharacterized protein C7974DRAFT_440680 [Boeremia exigua]KAH6618462.1 hypothetical protein C7974DRAFT_440680 [Boeremia exigua]
MQPGFTLAPRDPFADAKLTLSSWDNCMAKDYCKWPVIVAIILGGLIAISIVTCIARCICCGADSSGHRRMKSDAQGYPQPYPQQPYPQQPYPQAAYAQNNPYAEARSFAPPPPPPQISTQYQSHPAPSLARAPSNPSFNPQVNPLFARAPSPERPQFATFDAHKPANEDALPAMPSWDTARSVRVEVEEPVGEKGGVELDRLNHNGSVPGSAVGGAFAAGAAGGLGAGAMRGSPDAYAPRNQYANTSPAHSTADGYAATYNRGPSPAQSQSQYSQADGYAQYAAPQDRYNSPTPQDRYASPAPHERYNSPAPPSYHTTANPNPYAYAPAPARSPAQPYDSPAPSYAAGNAYDPPPRAQTTSPAAYPGQNVYQAFTPQGTGQGGYSGVQRRPVEGSARDV